MRPRSMSMVRMAWYCGSMPCTESDAALYRLLMRRLRLISGLTTVDQAIEALLARPLRPEA
jgi:hypothetical protein